MKKIVSLLLSVIIIINILICFDCYTFAADNDINFALNNLPEYPSDGQDFWVIFKEGFREGRVELSTCNLEMSTKEGAWILWDEELSIQNSSVDGECNQYYYNSKGEWEYMRSYEILTDWAVEVIASNLDVYDSEGNLIVKASSILAYQENSEDNYREKLVDKCSDTIVDFVYDDFDLDGNYEAFAATTTNMSNAEEEAIEIDLWFVNNVETTKVYSELRAAVVDRSKQSVINVLKYGNNKLIAVSEWYTTSDLAHIWYVSNGKCVYDSNVSGSLCFINNNTEYGWIEGCDSCYDGCVDDTGHTWKTYYFYFDNGLKEYGGMMISENDVRRIAGGTEIINSVKELGEIQSIFARENGIININYLVENELNYNLTLLYTNNSLKIIEYNEWQDSPIGRSNQGGVYSAAKFFNIATFPTSITQYGGGETEWQVAPNGFMLNKHNNKFIHYNCLDDNGNLIPETELTVKHSDCGFLGRNNHNISDDLLKAQLYNLSYTTGRLSLIQDRMNDKWSGSCYGIAATLGLTFNGSLNENDISSSYAEDYYSLRFPYENQKFSDSIEFYYLTQFLSGYGLDSNLCTSGIKNIFVNNENIDYWNSYFLNDYYKLLINDLHNNSTMILGYFHRYQDEDNNNKTGGHAIITCGIENLGEGLYDIWLYDENCREHFDHLYLKENGDKFDVQYKCGEKYTTLPSELLIMFHIPLDNNLGNIYPVNNDDLRRSAQTEEVTTIILNANNSFTLNDMDNNVISYNGEKLESDYDIKDFRVITSDVENTNNAFYEVSVEKQDKMLYNANVANTDVTIMNNDDYSAVKGENIDSIAFNNLDELEIKGSKYSFEASVNRMVNNVNQVVSINANANDNVNLYVDKNNEIQLVSDSKMTDIKIEISDNNSSMELETEDLKNIKICAEGHVFKDEVVESTCTKQGYTIHMCSNCNCYYKDNYTNVNVNVHSYGKAVVKKKATISKNGELEYKCVGCGTTKVATLFYPKNIKLKVLSYKYDGNVKKPEVIIKDADGKTIASSNYSLSFEKGRKKVGKYSVKVTFKGNYSGSKTLFFSIVPKETTLSKITAGKKQFKIRWKKRYKQTTGYQIQYSTDKNFKKGNKTVRIRKKATIKTTIKKLQSKKKYYVRIRVYKTVGKTNFFSSWSKNKTVKIK